jgi:hypothetical protein
MKAGGLFCPGDSKWGRDLRRVERLSDADLACLYNLALYWQQDPAADFGDFEPGRGGRQLARRLRGAGGAALGAVVHGAACELQRRCGLQRQRLERRYPGMLRAHDQPRLLEGDLVISNFGGMRVLRDFRHAALVVATADGELVAQVAQVATDRGPNPPQPLRRRGPAPGAADVDLLGHVWKLARARRHRCRAGTDPCPGRPKAREAGGRSQQAEPQAQAAEPPRRRTRGGRRGRRKTVDKKRFISQNRPERCRQSQQLVLIN